MIATGLYALRMKITILSHFVEYITETHASGNWAADAPPWVCKNIISCVQGPPKDAHCILDKPPFVET